jgi:hypothetical protein
VWGGELRGEEEGGERGREKMKCRRGLGDRAVVKHDIVGV